MVKEITVTEKGCGALAEIVRSEAHGGRVLLLTETGEGAHDLVAALSLAGLTLTRREVTDGVLSDYASLGEERVPEGVMAVVGAGGAPAIQAAKGVRPARHLPRFLIPLDLSGLVALDSRAFFGTKGDVLTLKEEGARVLIEKGILTSSSRLRAGLGILLAHLAEGIDGVYEALIKRGRCPAPALSLLSSAAARLVSIREQSAPADTVEVALAWAEEGLFDLPHSSAAHLFAMLASKKAGGRYDDYLFPAAYSLLRLYDRYLGDLPLEHAAPPDRARSVSALRTRCGLEETPLFARAEEYAEGYEDRARLTAEYREDFREIIEEGKLPLSAISRVYRRAGRKENEGGSLSPSELLSLLSLTGEAVSGYPLLRQIWATGLLEPLIAAS